VSERARDALGIYIPIRISTLSDTEILEQIEQLQARRESILSQLSTVKKATVTKGKQPKVQDLSKLDRDEMYLVLSAQMGITLDEFKRLAGAK
jgi:hypothetical protein